MIKADIKIDQESTIKTIIPSSSSLNLKIHHKAVYYIFYSYAFINFAILQISLLLPVRYHTSICVTDLIFASARTVTRTYVCMSLFRYHFLLFRFSFSSDDCSGFFGTCPATFSKSFLKKNKKKYNTAF